MPITFHIITNKDSIKYVNTIVEMINKTSNCDFRADILTLADIIEKTTTEICPSMNIKDEFCEIIMGNMTPLIFPYLFPKLDHAIYISREIVFQVGMPIETASRCSKCFLMGQSMPIIKKDGPSLAILFFKKRSKADVC